MDPKRRRATIGLAAMAVVGVGLFSALFGLPALLTDWYRQVAAQVNQLPINNPDVMYASALQYQHEGNNAMATAAARRALIVSPSYVPAHRFLAADALKRNDFEGAAKECRGIIASDPNDGAAQLGLASAYEGMGDSGKAQGIYQNVVENAALGTEVRRAAQQRLGGRSARATAPPAPAPSSPAR